MYWTDGHHPDIYEHVVQEIKHDYSYPPLDNFIWGFHNLQDRVDEFYDFQGSGNVRFDKVRLPDEKVQEIINTLNGIIQSGYKIANEQLSLPFSSPSAQSSDTKIVVVPTPEESHGSGSGYPFFYNIATDTLYIADNESLHMELIEAAGIDLTEEDYLYGAGGDAGYSAGFLSGRAGGD